MKHILIALDYYPSAQLVAETGYTLAKSMTAQITLIHVVTDPVYYSSTAYSPIMGFGSYSDIDLLQLDIDEGLKKAAHEFLDKTCKHLKDETIQTIAAEGDVAEAILIAAKQTKSDLIVMGSHSRKWLAEIIMGSTTAKVLHTATIPVLIIPTKNE